MIGLLYCHQTAIPLVKMSIVADILMDEMMFKALFLIEEKFVASLQVVII